MGKRIIALKHSILSVTNPIVRLISVNAPIIGLNIKIIVALNIDIKDSVVALLSDFILSFMYCDNIGSRTDVTILTIK